MLLNPLQYALGPSDPNVPFKKECVNNKDLSGFCKVNLGNFVYIRKEQRSIKDSTQYRWSCDFILCMPQ